MSLQRTTHEDQILAAAAELELRRRRRRRVTANLTSLPGFATNVLGLAMWPRFEEVLTAIQEHDRVTIRAGRKVSKSLACVTAALWWSLRGGKVLMTSATYAQLEDPLWLELERLVRNSGLNIHVPLAPETAVRVTGGGRIVGRAAAQRENLQGPSGAQSMYIVDEASGVRREIIEAIEGNVAGGGKIILAGNPTRLSGKFYDSHHREASEWRTIHISSRESPNVVTGDSIIPGLAVRSWVEAEERKHGADSAFVAVHIDGQFPTTGDHSVIPLGIVTDAEKRHPTTVPFGTLTIGVDVARSGTDHTIVYPRRGKVAYPALQGHGLNTEGVVTLIHAALERHLEPGEEATINIDVIGIGAGVYDLAHDTFDQHIVNGVNVATTATDTTYRLLRDQIWFAIREWLLEGGALPGDEATREELISAEYQFDARGRYRVDSKDVLRERLGRSPDHADALGLSIYVPPDTTPRARSLA